MRYVLSLIAAAAKAPLTRGDLKDARAALDAAGGRFAQPVWLAPETACEMPFEGKPDETLAGVRAVLSDRPIDVNVLPASGRRKLLLLADMDSTMIEQECIDELAAEIGERDRVAAITERAMRGEIAFEPALRERVALLRDLPVEVAERVLATRITLMPGARTLIATMGANGAHTVLVSGGFTLFTGKIAERLGFREHRANTLVSHAGRLTGVVAEPVLGRDAKEQALSDLTTRCRLRPEATLAVGDGANDLGMIIRAGLGVAYRAKPALRARAAAAIDHADLTGLLFLQGYRSEEFVDPA